MSNKAYTANSKLTIKIAKKNDAELILEFIRKLADYEKLSNELQATPQILKQSLFGKRKVAEVIIAYDERQPVGFALFFHNFSTFLGKPGIYIEDIFVNEESRGRGIGLSLLRYVANLAIERDCGRLEWSVLDWNEPAINFYLKLGAKPMNGWTTYRVTGNVLQNLADL